MAKYSDAKIKQLKPMRAQRQQAFDALVDELARSAHSDTGFFGPSSVSWRMTREAVLFGTGMAPLLLQVAHPMVAQAVADYSKYAEQPLARAYRTFDAVFKIVYGSRDTAVQVAKRTFAIHNAIAGTFDDVVPGYGTDYDSCDGEAMLWIYATLMYAVWKGHELLVAPVPKADRTTWYQESKVFALLFGVPETLIPPDFDAFVSYYEGMMAGERIVVTPTAQKVAVALKQGVGFPLTLSAPARNAVGALLLPAKIREAYAMPYDPASRALAHTTLAAMRTAAHLVPTTYRSVPAYRNALRRTGELPERALGRRLDKALVDVVQRVAMPA